MQTPFSFGGHSSTHDTFQCASCYLLFKIFYILLLPFIKKIKLLIWLCWVLVAACEIQLPDQGWNPGPVHWEFGVFVLDHQGSPPAAFLLGGLDVTWDLGDPDVLCLVFPLL